MCLRRLHFIFILSILLIASTNIYCQTAGTGIWQPKNINLDDLALSRSCSGAGGSISVGYSFAINDTLYIGGKGIFVRYNRLENSFTTLPDAPINPTDCGPRFAYQSFVIGNSGYLFSDNFLYSFNSRTKVWSQVQAFPGTDLENATISVVNDKAYIIGGLKPFVVGQPRQSSNEVWVFDPIPRSFVKLNPMPISANGYLNSSAVGNKIYYIIGPNLFFEYNPIIDTWTQKPAPNFVFRNTAVGPQYESIIGMFTFGGELYLTTCINILSTYGDRRTYKWNTTTETWSIIGIATWPNSAAAGTQFYVPTSREVFDISGIAAALPERGSRTILSWTPNSGVIQTTSVTKLFNRCINLGENLTFSYSYLARGQFNLTNKFYLELSDSLGNFTGAKLDSVQTAVTNLYQGLFEHTLPPSIWDTTKKFRVRVTSSSPNIDDDFATYLKDIITFNPDTTIVSSNQFICEGSFITLSVNNRIGDTYQWFKNDIFINGQTQSQLRITDPGIYNAVIRNSSNCQTVTRKVDLTLSTLPVAPSVSGLTYCVGSTSSALTAGLDVGNSLVWYGNAATGGAGSSTAPVPSTSTAGIFDYYVSQRNTTTGCESPRAKLTVTVGSAPSAPTVASVSYCVGSTPTALTATASAGNSLVWYGNAAAGGTGSATAPIPSTSTEGVFDYYVSQRNTTTGCEGPRAKLTVTVGVAPTAPTVTGLSYCVGTTPTALTATASAGNSLVWYGNAATGGTGSSTAPVPSTATAGVFDYYVSQRNTTTGCESPRAKLTVTVDPSPTAPTVAAISYCIGSTSTALTATASAGNSLVWYGNAATGGTGSSTAPVPSTATAGMFDYYVSQRNTTTGCESPRAKLTVTITATPNKPQITRDNNNNNLVSSANNGNQWYLEGSAISGATGSTFKPVNSGNYTVQVSINSCKSSFSDVYYYLVSGIVSLTRGESITFSPNPVKNKFKIQFSLANTSIVTVKILDYRGAKVFESQSLKSGDIVNLQNLISGSYIVTVYNKNGQLIYSDNFLKD